MSSILDTVIASIFVFLIFSLAVSALNEWLLGLLDRRASFLKLALQELLNTTTYNRDGKPIEHEDSPVTVNKFLCHGLITSLSRGSFDANRPGTQGVPSYIPADSFSGAIVSLLGDGNNLIARSQIEKLPQGSRIRDALLTIFDETKGEIALFRSRVETWFNEGMDRATGWYKRYTQKWMLVLAFVLAGVCNVDSLHIIRETSSNAELREQLVQAARTLESEMPESPAEPPAEQPPVAADTGQMDAAQARQNFHDAINRMESAGIPIGWPELETYYDREWYEWSWVVAGWMLSALGASLGAPFWFDTLNRFMNIRSAGPKPGTEPKPPISTPPD